MALRRLDVRTLPTHRARLLALAADAPPRWGGLDAAGMVAHLRAVVEASLGEREVPRLLPAVLGKPLGVVAFFLLPRLPRRRRPSTPRIPALCPPPEHGLDGERERLLAALERFVARLDAEPRARTVHPYLGPTSVRTWARVHEVHLRHHERQFGLA